MKEPVGKIMATDEHGRVLDETDVVLDGTPDLRNDGGSIKFKFVRPLGVVNGQILKLELFENAVQRDTRNDPLPEAPKPRPTKTPTAE